MSKIKLYFLTGFLGAGKTTILRNLLENMEGTKVGVIQNELGKISIDGTVLQNNDRIEQRLYFLQLPSFILCGCTDADGTERSGICVCGKLWIRGPV
jgi:G3E family GTPase